MNFLKKHWLIFLILFWGIILISQASRNLAKGTVYEGTVEGISQWVPWGLLTVVGLVVFAVCFL